MGEAQSHGMQPLATKVELCGQHRISAIGQITHTRVPQCREVNANLMGSAGFKTD
jgi:hypothetical protein